MLNKKKRKAKHKIIYVQPFPNLTNLSLRLKLFHIIYIFAKICKTNKT